VRYSARNKTHNYPLSSSLAWGVESPVSTGHANHTKENPP
jgi:hypothetical protein